MTSMETGELKIAAPKLLTGPTNWVIWKNGIIAYLKFHGAYTAVTGELLDPAEIVPTVENRQQVKQRDAKVFQNERLRLFAYNAIMTTLNDEVQQLVKSHYNPKDIWDHLHSLYEQKGRQRQSRLLEEFFGFKKDPKDNMATHVSKLKTLWNDVNEEMHVNDQYRFPDSILMFKLLNSLPSDKYFDFQNAWESVPADQQTSKVLIERLQNFELRDQERFDFGQSEALAVINGGRQRANHAKRVQRKFFTENETRKCYNCSVTGHLSRNCPKPQRERKNKPTQKNQNENAIFADDVCFASTAVQDVWILDSGASHHMTPRREWFKCFTVFNPPKMILVGKEGVNVSAQGFGDIDVTTIINNKEMNVTMKDVWFVPELGRNLYSMLTGYDRGLKFHVERDMYGMKKGKRWMIPGKRVGSIVWLNLEAKVPESTADAALASDEETLQIWHERLAHQNKKHVKDFLKQREIDVNVTDEFCDACCYGKMHRLSFGTRTDRATKPGEVVHSDLCGPMQTKTLGGRLYYAVFKDDYSKYRNVYFLKKKSELKEKLVQFLAEVKTLGHTIKEMITDGGTEYNNAEVNEITTKAGLKHRVTMPYTPQQNGSAERENRILMEAARSMLFAKDLPEFLWGEAVNTAAYVLNRTGPTMVNGSTPYELWTGKKTSVNHLRVFGTDCFVHVPDQKRHKLQRKAVKGILVGYCDHDGYRVYIPKTRIVVSSRDVKFKPEETVTLQKPDEWSLTEKNKRIVENEVLRNVQEEEISKNDEDNHDEDEENDEGEVESIEQVDDKDENEHSYNLRDRSTINRPRWLDSYEAFLAEEPQTIREALRSDDAEAWRRAIEEELQSLKTNKTWDLVELPKGRQTVTNKWVFRLKKNADGSIRHKARLVARGFSQQSGTDFNETFAPVVRYDTIRTLLSVASQRQMTLTQFDVKTAFLYGNIDEEIYMTQPIGFDDGTSRVCKLQRSLYGLKQSPRCWNQRLTNFLIEQGFKQSSNDYCLYTRLKGEKRLFLAIYVDDGLIVGDESTEVTEMVAKLKTEFQITSGRVSNYLGINIHEKDNGIFIEQKNHIERMLQKFGMSEAKFVSTPMVVGCQQETAEEKKFVDASLFRSAIGCLTYLATVTRPDIAFAVNTIAQQAVSPTENDWAKVKRVFRYMKGTSNFGLFYDRNGGKLEAFSDADYAGDCKTRRSTSGIVCLQGDAAIMWRSQKQRCVSLSTTEAEYIAGSEAAKEIVWLRRLIEEMTGKAIKPILRIDNSSAVKLVKNPEFHQRSKHIDIRYHFIREKVEKGVFEVCHVDGNNQKADILTKALSHERHRYLCQEIGLKTLQIKGEC